MTITPVPVMGQAAPPNTSAPTPSTPKKATPSKPKPKIKRATTRRPVIDTNGQGAERTRQAAQGIAPGGSLPGTGPAVGAGVRAPLQRHIVRVGGAAWLSTGVSRPGRVGAARQGFLRTELWPRAQYFLSHRWAVGAEGGLRLAQFEDQAGALPASGDLPALPAGRLRISEGGAGVTGILSFHQPVVPRLYVLARVGVGAGGERVLVDWLPNPPPPGPSPLPDPIGTTRLRQILRYEQGQAGAGFLYMPVPSLGIEGMITYRVRHYRIREADLGALGRRIYLPEGEFTEQGLIIQLGLDWFFDLERTWQALRKSPPPKEGYGPVR